MSVRCVCFDLDDTLWDCETVIIRAEKQLYQWLGANQPEITRRYTQEKLVDSRVHYMRQRPELHHDLGELRLQWLSMLATELELEQDWINPAFECFLQARSEVELFPNVLEQLEQLEKHYMLGVITNGNADVRRTDLSHLFHFVHSSAAAGVAKPDPAIFAQALAMADLEPHQMVYVGDDPEKDIIGASRAGLRTIWYNPSRQGAGEAVNPDATMTNFSDIAKLVRSL